MHVQEKRFNKLHVCKHVYFVLPYESYKCCIYRYDIIDENVLFKILKGMNNI